ncbi:MAG: sulfite exporter TauE/SafE family protein [Proteobacteria bacterium]|nr:sulfite exporter TauE/SafE family protein [Pseudomonadota bacterium]
MTLSATVVIAIASAFLLAGAVKGVIGMGLPTVSVGIMSLVVSPAEAAALLVIPSVVTNIWQFLAGPRAGQILRRLWPTMAAICVGTWLARLAGVSLLTPAAAARATVALGIVLMLYAAIGLARVHIAVRSGDESWLGPLAGFATGVISAATSVFVIPLVPYFQAIGLDKDDLVQAQGLGFTVATLALAAILAIDGVLNLGNVPVSAAAVAPAVAGMAIGQILRHYVRPATFRLCFFIAMFALGAHLALAHR